MKRPLFPGDLESAKCLKNDKKNRKYFRNNFVPEGINVVFLGSFLTWGGGLGLYQREPSQKKLHVLIFFCTGIRHCNSNGDLNRSSNSQIVRFWSVIWTSLQSDLREILAIRAPQLQITTRPLNGPFESVFHGGGVPENSQLALMGLFPSLMAVFRPQWAVSPECLNGPFSLLKSPGKQRSKTRGIKRFLNNVWFWLGYGGSNVLNAGGGELPLKVAPKKLGLYDPQIEDFLSPSNFWRFDTPHRSLQDMEQLLASPFCWTKFPEKGAKIETKFPQFSPKFALRLLVHSW